VIRFTQADVDAQREVRVVDHPAEGMHAKVFWVHPSGDRARVFTLPNKSCLLLRSYQAEPVAS
jgi:hypothetical protein